MYVLSLSLSVCVCVHITSNFLLCRPISLELTAVNEGVIMDNMHVFRKNGFEFSVDEDGKALLRHTSIIDHFIHLKI